MFALAESGTDRGRGQVSPLAYDKAVRIVTLAAPMDGAIVACLFMAGTCRAEVAALEWRDLEDGAAADVRLVKNGFAGALRSLRPADAAPDAKVFGGRDAQTIGRRFQRAAKAAGIERRLSAHSGRVGLASELTARGASEQEVMVAGAWKTSRMVAHYSAGARAERGAVAKYL